MNSVSAEFSLGECDQCQTGRAFFCLETRVLGKFNPPDMAKTPVIMIRQLWPALIVNAGEVAAMNDSDLFYCPKSPSDRVPLEKVIMNDELNARPSRAPDYRAESEAMRAIAQKISQSPETAMNELVEQAMKLCRAESAGISVAEKDGEKEVFRWRAVAGRLLPFVNGAMPGDFSPCGEVVRRREPLAMRGLIRHFEYVEAIQMPLYEVLLHPFFKDGKPIGTIWVVLHADTRKFEPEDLRLLRSLAEFTTGIMGNQLALQQYKETIDELSAERDLRERFVATLTHDLRTPLSSAKLAAQLLKRKKEISSTHELDRIVSCMNRADRMIQDLLDANRINANEPFPLFPVECRFDDIVTEIVNHLNEIYGNRFEVQFQGADMKGYWDPEAIQRIIENLASNAAKYGQANRPIQIRLRRKESVIELSVHNEGNPIAQVDQVRLFKPYQRADTAVVAGQKGWGLGLTLVKGLVEAHQGRVRVQSSEATGTTFSAEFPL